MHREPITLEETNQKLWHALAATSVLYLLVGSFWFQHWYVLWVLAPAALVPNSRFTRSVLPWLIFGALGSNVAMDFLLSGMIKTSPPIVKYTLVVVMIWGPALLAVVILAFARWRKKAGAKNDLPLLNGVQ